MGIPRPAAEKLGVDRQDPDLDGLLLGLIRRATGGCHEHAARLDPMYGIGQGRGLKPYSLGHCPPAGAGKLKLELESRVLPPCFTVTCVAPVCYTHLRHMTTQVSFRRV